MEHRNEKVCRLCLKIICNNSFEHLEGNIVNNLNNILALELYTTKAPVICKDCVINIYKSSDFKSACIFTEKHIASFATCNYYAKLNLKDVYLQNKSTEISSITENQQICRFCLKLTEKSYSILVGDVHGNALFQMLEMFMPELKLNATKEPVTCEECLDSLQDYFSFLVRCLDVEDKINNYIDSMGTDSADQAILNDVLWFVLGPAFAKMKKSYSVEMNINEQYDSCLTSQNFEASDTFLENKLCTMEKSKIKEECPGETSYPEFDIQKAEKVFVVGENIVVKAEVPAEISNGTQKVDLNDEDSTSFMQIENDSEINEGIPEIDTKSFADVEHSESSPEQDIQQVLEQNDYKSFQDEGCRKQKSVRIKRTGTRVKLGGYSEIIIFKRSGNSTLAIYKCKICGYETKYKHVSIRHSLIHKKPSEITMYKCELCSYQTKYKTYLKPHMLIHKNPSEIIMYKCDICSHETKRKELLTRHMLSHRDPGEIPMYKCDLCDFKGKQKSYLKRHSLVHMNSESQIYRCARCSFGTKHKQGLRRHMFTHKDPSEMTMFKCEMCPYKSKYKNQCDKHILTHTNTLEAP